MARRQPKQARSEQTINTLLEAAFFVLNEHGFDGFSTDRVAEKAGLSVGTIYQYFGDKYDLLVALMKRWLEETAVATAGMDGPERVKVVFESYRNQPGGQELLAAFRSIPRLQPFLDDAIEDSARTTAVRLTGKDTPTAAEVSRARVMAIASDAVLSAAARASDSEARRMVATFAEWAEEFSTVYRHNH